MAELDEVTVPEDRGPEPWATGRPGVPLFLNVTLTIKPDSRDLFLAALRDFLPAARAEPACLFLHVGQSVAEPDVFVLSEGWRDSAEFRDLVLHKPYAQTYRELSESTYARPRVVLPLTPIDPEL